MKIFQSALYAGLMLSTVSMVYANQAAQKEPSHAAINSEELAKKIESLQKQLNAQKRSLEELARKDAQDKTEIKEIQKNLEPQWPAKYLGIPGTNSAIKFNITPRFQMAYDAGATPGDDLVASSIPLKRVNSDAASSGHTAMSARSSRLGFETVTKTSQGKEIKSRFEMDFYGNGTSTGSSSYDPRLRHAFFTYNPWQGGLWTIGQTNTLFRDEATEGTTVDYQGSIGSLRQAQLRYTHQWNKEVSTALSLERPLTDGQYRTTNTNMLTENGTSVSGFTNRVNASGGTTSYGRTTMPDVIASAKYEGTWGYVNLRGIYRELKVRAYNVSNAPDFNASKGATGAGLAVRLNVYGKNNIFGQLNGGTGIARYFPEMAGQSAIVDLRSGSQNMSLTQSRQMIMGYQHFWNDAWQSNLVYTTTRSTASSSVYRFLDSDTAASNVRFNKQLDHVHANTLCAVTKELDVGVEYAYGSRTTVENRKGNANRVVMMARYTF